MKDGLACFGLFILAAAAIVAGAIMNGWVLSILWGWFVVPLFGLPALKLAPAIGFALVVGLLTKQSKESSDKKKDTTELVAAIIGEVLVGPLVALLFGWIVYQFI